MGVLTREELIEKLKEIEFWPELLPDLNFYLDNYISIKDINMVNLLLKAGANPNPDEDLDCYLHYLLHEYLNNKSLKGDLILSIMEALLKGGANPNRVWANNYRAYDYAVEMKLRSIKDLLEKYGADKLLRKYV